MKIIVLGAGALGSILAAALTRSGQDVILLARGARAELLRKQGIGVSGIIEDTVQVAIETDPAALPAADLLIVRGDPSADILMAADKANHIAVVKNGTRIDTAAGAGAQPDVTRHRGPQMPAASLF